MRFHCCAQENELYHFICVSLSTLGCCMYRRLKQEENVGRNIIYNDPNFSDKQCRPRSDCSFRLDQTAPKGTVGV